MRPLLPFAAPHAGGPRLVEIAGSVTVRTGVEVRIAPFERRATVVEDAGTVSVLTVRTASDGVVVDLDAGCSLQRDGVLMVTIALRAHHPSEPDAEALDVETTVALLGGASPFHLTCVDADGCRAEVRGTVGLAERR